MRERWIKWGGCFLGGGYRLGDSMGDSKYCELIGIIF